MILIICKDERRLLSRLYKQQHVRYHLQQPI